MKSFELRKKFLDYFAKNGHTIVSSSSLIPAEDPTLLFTNAGMNQFKDIFLGKETRSYKRATTSQKCVRAGGKHNDLEQVGFTARHLTFFEMLGNFSFGDYFKKEAIGFAWEFLTKDVGLPADKLYATVFKTDDEAFEIWNKVIGLPESRISRLGEKDNFWQMGDTGPCGPCTEIYVDRGTEKGCGSKQCSPGCDCDRFVEIWNLVFMQFNRQADGQLNPLDKKGVDTGMGLERLCMIVQGKETVFDTDVFTSLIEEIEKLTNFSYTKSPENLKASFRVLAEHIRSASFLIADGCSPSNDGRGYVLRKIIRRAAMFARKLSDSPKLISNLSQKLINQMSNVYPELETNKQLILSVLDSEVEKFATNLIQGQNIFDKYLAENKQEGLSFFSGKQVFKLYDTYGFPFELTQFLAREQGFIIDNKEFEAEMQKQRESSGKKLVYDKSIFDLPENISSEFVGYETHESKSKILFIHKNDDQTSWLVMQKTPFYAESGGQVSDKGWITVHGHALPVIELQKVGSVNNPTTAAKISLKAETATIADIKIGDDAVCVVDICSRNSIVKNHTAAHLLQAALMQILGAHIKQSGSYVCADYLRFDFSHNQALTQEEIHQVETLINQKIQEDIKTNIYNTTLDKARQAGVTAFFGEKYNPENVRVVLVPGFSAELCGGTHAQSTGVIGCFKITSETALSTGTRRIQAITGHHAVTMFQQTFDVVKKLSEKFKVKFEHVSDAVTKYQEQHQDAITQIKQLNKKLLLYKMPAWEANIQEVGKVPFLYLELEDVPAQELRTICTDLEKRSPGFYFVINKPSNAEQFSYFAFQSQKASIKVNLKLLADFLKEKFGLRGGGNNESIQGGGQTLDKNFETLLVEWIKNQ
ncbi:MAG: Alanine-tRNA ligase [candidate division TM6 bacterium GW2011_GWF2_37_49]|nr:MAG: Alanine-tRNA ligase [candidate division TM6 bacterium GW2011_GWF2_37_49]